MTDQFLNNILSIHKGDIPNSVYDHARLCFLDYIACTVAGAKLYADKERAYLRYVSSDEGECSVLWHRAKTTMQTASMLNGISAHAIELDDGHRTGMIHLGAPIISALLAVAEKERMSSDDFLYGIVIGYEVAIRLACAIQPGCKLKGFHATGVCGTVGATMAIAAASKFDFDQMKSAFSAAATSASGLLEMTEGDTHLKPFNAGHAAMNAVSAAYIGKAGFRAPDDALGGRRGFLNAVSDSVKKEYLTDFREGYFYIDTIYNKPYAACRHTHPSIEAAMQIRLQKGFVLDDIESISVDTYSLAVNGHDHTEIKGINSAKMSIPYSLSVALVTGKAGLEEYSEEMVQNPKILEIASKTSVKAVEELSELCPKKRVAVVNVNTKYGKFTSRIEYPKGEPENPLTKEEFQQKIEGLMLFAGYEKKICDMLTEIVYRTEFRIDEIMSLL